MSKDSQKISFEEALAGLEKSAEAIKNQGTSLEEAIKSFETGVKYYETCSRLLEDAKQRVLIYDKTSEGLRPYEESTGGDRE